MNNKFKVYIDPNASDTNLETRIKGIILDWQLCGYYLPYNPFDGSFNPDCKDQWWYNSKTGEEREYLGEFVEPENCPIRKK